MAIGFNTSINCTLAELWTEDFYAAMLNGYTVQEAVTSACQLSEDHAREHNAMLPSNSDDAITPITEQVVEIFGNHQYQLIDS